MPRWLRKPALLKLHRWVGLATGAIIVIVCLSGALLVFEPQVSRSMHPEYYTVRSTGTRLTLDAMLGQLRTFNSLIQPAEVTVPDDPTGTVTVRDRRGDTHILDPWTGRVLAYDYRRPAFFRIVERLHTHLLDDEFGEWLVLGSTIGLSVSLLIGLVLWWPRTVRTLVMRLSLAQLFGRRVSWRRRNYDLHVVLGIYALPVLFILGFTGLGFDADWFYAGVDAVAGAPAPPARPGNTGTIQDGLFTLDAALQAARRTLGARSEFTVAVPLEVNEPIAVTAPVTGSASRAATDAAWFDRYTGRLLRVDRHADQPLGVRMRRALDPIHLATSGGLPTQVIGFIAMVLGVVFPITGFLMWYPRWRRQRRGSPPEAEEAALPSVLEEPIG